MDGDFFMKRIRTWFLLALGALCLTYGAGLVKDHQALREGLVRLHVVGQSDSQEDQSLKLKVRDAVTERLEGIMSRFSSADEAEAYLRSHLQELKALARQVLTAHGSGASVEVSLQEEAFPTREYDTFRLPAGVYQALRITIGEGEGRNWWCVLFPGLCVPASSEEFQEVAEVGGFSQELGQTLSLEQPQRKIRFWILDWMGRLENLFFGE